MSLFNDGDQHIVMSDDNSNSGGKKSSKKNEAAASQVPRTNSQSNGGHKEKSATNDGDGPARQEITGHIPSDMQGDSAGSKSKNKSSSDE